jgi:hypothetical protein
MPALYATTRCYYLQYLLHKYTYIFNIEILASNPCDQARNPGEGQSNLPRWYYDRLTRTCQQFTYRYVATQLSQCNTHTCSGLRGNQNNFITQQQCEQTCDVFPNPCYRGEPYRGADNRPQRCNSLTTTSSCPSQYVRSPRVVIMTIVKQLLPAHTLRKRCITTLLPFRIASYNKHVIYL